MVLFLGVAGGTGSGKTTLARRLREALGESVALLQHDWYYRDRSHLSEAEREAINYDEPAALENELLLRHLDELGRGAPIEAPRYDFSKHARAPETHAVRPAPIVVVEGILLFTIPELVERFDLRIYVDTDDDIRLLRRLHRDLVERGRSLASIEEQYLRTVRPMHRLHVEPSKARAHLIVPEGGENDEALDVIVGRLRFLIGPR